VKGHKRLKRLLPVINDIMEKGLHEMSIGNLSRIDFSLGNLERQAEEDRAFLEQLGKMRGYKRLAKILKN